MVLHPNVVLTGLLRIIAGSAYILQGIRREHQRRFRDNQ